MSGISTGRAPKTDAEWSRDVEKRLRSLENPSSARVGPWVFNNVEDHLQVSRPGVAPILLDLIPAPGFGEFNLGKLKSELSNTFVTRGDLAATVTSNPESAWEDFLDWADNLPLIGPLVEAITGVVKGGIEDLRAWAATVPLLVGGLLDGSWIPGLDAAIITTGQFIRSKIVGLSDLLVDFVDDGTGIVTQLLGRWPKVANLDTMLGGGLSTGLSIVDQIIGKIPGLGTGIRTGLNGLGDVFTDVMGLFGGPTGLGSGTPTLPTLVSNIPVLKKLLNSSNLINTSLIGGLSASVITTGQFIWSQIQDLPTVLGGGISTTTSIVDQILAKFPGKFAGLAGISGLGSVITDLMGLFGSPTSLGSGTPVLAAVTSIPVLKKLLNVSNVITPALIGGLAASVITSGFFSWSQVDSLSTLFGGGLAKTSSVVDQLLNQFPHLSGGLSGLTGLAGVFGDLTGLMGSPTALGSGSPVLPGLLSIPLFADLFSGGLLKRSWLPNLDAAIITTGNIAQSFITNLVTDLAARVQNTIWQLREGAGSNLVVDPKFENSFIVREFTSGSPGDGSLVYSTAAARSGSQSMLLTTSTATSGQGDWMYLSTNNLGGALLRTVASALHVQAAQKFYLEIYVKGKVVSSGAGTVNLGVIARDSTGVNGESRINAATLTLNSLSTAGWTKLSGVVNVPANYDNFWPFIGIIGATTAARSIYIDDAMVREETLGQNIGTALWGAANTIGATIQNVVIPGLDAAIITTGQFIQTQVKDLATMLGGGLATTASIVDQILGKFPNLKSSVVGTGLTGLGNVLTDLSGLLGSPTQMGGGTPVLPAAGSIPVLKKLMNSGATLISTSFIGGLDAAVITTGTFAWTLVDSLSTLFGGGLAKTTSIVDQILGKFPHLGIGVAGTGLTGLGNVLTDLHSLIGSPTLMGSGSPTLPAAGSIPVIKTLMNTGATLVNTSFIGGLSATVITTDQIAKSVVPDITQDMSSDLDGFVNGSVNAINNTIGTLGQSWQDVETAWAKLPTMLHNFFGGHVTARASADDASMSLSSASDTLSSHGLAIASVTTELAAAVGTKIGPITFTDAVRLQQTSSGALSFTAPTWWILGTDIVTGVAGGGGAGGDGAGLGATAGSVGNDSTLAVSGTGGSTIGTNDKGAPGTSGTTGSYGGESPGTLLFDDWLFTGGAAQTAFSGGGHAPSGGGAAGNGLNRYGGNAGALVGHTWKPSITATITGTVGAGGAGGTGAGGNGGHGATGSIWLLFRKAMLSGFTGGVTKTLSAGTRVISLLKYTGAGTVQTDGQLVSGIWNAAPGGTGAGHLLFLRGNASLSSLVYLLIWYSAGNTNYELGCINANTPHIMKTGTISETIPFNNFALVCDTGRTYTILINGQAEDAYDDSGTLFSTGPSSTTYREAGWGSSDTTVVSGLSHGSFSQWAYMDNGTLSTIQDSYVANSDSTTTTASYGDLTSSGAITGPSVSNFQVPASGVIKVDIYAHLLNDTAGDQAWMGFQITGDPAFPSGILGDDSKSIMWRAPSSSLTIGDRKGSPFTVRGLTPGATIAVKSVYKAGGGGTAKFSDRRITVDPQ